MDRDQIVVAGLLRRAQRFPSEMLIGKQRISAQRRDVDSVEARAGRGTGLKAPVCMPVFSEQRASLVRFAPDRGNVLVTSYWSEKRIMAEPTHRQGEAFKIIVRQKLVGKGQHMTFKPSRADICDGLRIQLLFEIDSGHVCAARLTGWNDLKRHQWTVPPESSGLSLVSAVFSS